MPLDREYTVVSLRCVDLDSQDLSSHPYPAMRTPSPDPRFTPDVNDGMLAGSTAKVGGHWTTVAVNDEGQDAGYGIRVYLHF